MREVAATRPDVQPGNLRARCAAFATGWPASQVVNPRKIEIDSASVISGSLQSRVPHTVPRTAPENSLEVAGLAGEIGPHMIATAARNLYRYMCISMQVHVANEPIHAFLPLSLFALISRIERTIYLNNFLDIYGERFNL